MLYIKKYQEKSGKEELYKQIKILKKGMAKSEIWQFIVSWYNFKENTKERGEI